MPNAASSDSSSRTPYDNAEWHPKIIERGLQPTLIAAGVTVPTT